MEATDLIKKIRKIEIKSRGLSNQIFSGEYHSAFKGRGMTFSEVREYQFGDEIRTIDWNVTARFNHPFVKVYNEEREMTVMLLIDVSASGNFGSHQQTKRELITELAATLAFSAIQNNDKVGAILFTKEVEQFIPPKKGRSHILRIIKTVLEFKPAHKETNVGQALRFFTNAIKRRSTAFIISDFMDDYFLDPLKIAARKHDLIALKIEDALEKKFISIGVIKLNDEETGESFWIDTSSKEFEQLLHKNSTLHNLKVIDWFKKSGVDLATVQTNQSYVKPLMNLFKRREGR
ncbi:MAG: DUF58 domain-containing protein [Bacteroidia bacterium]|nr:DUF58 domain-containing protein [Bacteroidia bacterium]